MHFHLVQDWQEQEGVESITAGIIQHLSVLCPSLVSLQLLVCTITLTTLALLSAFRPQFCLAVLQTIETAEATAVPGEN